MAPQDNEKLRKRISELIGRPKNVDYKEIKWVLDQLGAFPREAKHGVMFKIPGCQHPLMLNRHNDGKNHLPSYCVADFCKRMVELGLYEMDKSDDDD